MKSQVVYRAAQVLTPECVQRTPYMHAVAGTRCYSYSHTVKQVQSASCGDAAIHVQKYTYSIMQLQSSHCSDVVTQ